MLVLTVCLSQLVAAVLSYRWGLLDRTDDLELWHFPEVPVLVVTSHMQESTIRRTGGIWQGDSTRQSNSPAVLEAGGFHAEHVQAGLWLKAARLFPSQP